MSELQASPGTELAVYRSGDIATLTKLEEILLGTGDADAIDYEAPDPAEISREIVMQLLAAESDEELEAFGGATGWRELLGVPMELHGFNLRPSAFEGEGGPPVFFVVFANRLDSGDRVTLTTGSWNVLAQLTNLARRGTLAGSVWMLTEADKQTAAGYKPLWLKRPDSIDGKVKK